MARTASIDYNSLFKKYSTWKEAGGKSLRKFCLTRRPNLNYDAVKKAFAKIQKEGKNGEKKEPSVKKVPKKSPKKTAQKPTGTKSDNLSKLKNLKKKKDVDISKIAQKNGKKLTPKRKRLLEMQLNGQGRTNGEMARAAGYTAVNASKAFLEAQQSANYQDALAKSKAELREKIGIPGEVALRRLWEIGLSRMRDIAKLENGNLDFRKDVTFDTGGDLALKGFTIKNVKKKSKHLTETVKEYKVEQSDNKGALNDVLRLGGYLDNEAFNAGASKNSVIRELWDKYRNGKATIIELIAVMAFEGVEMPKPLELIAKAELAKKIAGGLDKDVDLFEFDNEIFERDAIERKKNAIEQQRKEELAQREIELEELNAEDDARSEHHDVVLNPDQYGSEDIGDIDLIDD